MKFIMLIFFTMFLSQISFSQGINFQEGNFEEILAKAKKEKKLIFVDCYTVWCGPCKKLVKEVFPQGEVGAFFNENYISYSLDMEKGEGIELAKYYNVTAFPTLLFLDANGNLLTRTEGFVDAKTLIEKAKISKKISSKPANE